MKPHRKHIARRPLAEFLRALESLGIPYERDEHADGCDVRLGHGEGDPGLVAQFEFDEAGNWQGWGLWTGSI